MDPAASGPHAPPAETVSDDQRRADLVRRYATRVTIVLMIVCPMLFLAGMWGSGVAPEQLFAMPDRYNPASDICLRLGWQRVAGKADLVRVCSEWLQSSDPSGETHQLQKTLQIVETADGRLYFDYGSRADWHLFAFIAFVAGILAFGWYVRRYLVTRYRRHLEHPAGKQACASHP